MTRLALTAAAYAALAVFVLIICASALTMGQNLAYRHCDISAAQLDDPVKDGGSTR